MRLVEWTDINGLKRKAFVRDEDDDQIAIDGQGIPCDPPNVWGLDWQEIARSLHNTLVDRGLLTWQDVQQQQNGVTAAVLSALRRPVILLYKQEEKEDVSE